MTQVAESEFKPSACMLCSIGCAIEIQVEGRHFRKIRGDKLAPSSQGYICQKAARLDHYQNHSERLKQPLKRQPDGSFAPISWDQAIREIAGKMKAIKAAHGGHAFAYYGGGGQGNHLGGTYSGALRAALETPYLYSALAQEKTGDFWVNGELFGRQSVLPLEGMEHADYAIVLGANPFAAHGLPRTRDVLKAFRSDPARTLVVIDPRVSETAKMADIHLQVKPGHDAYLLAAMIAILFRENRVDEDFLHTRTTGHEAIRKLFESLPVEDFIEASGVPAEKVHEVARGFSSAHRATVRADLGIQQSLHSTLNSWLEKLLYLVTGNFNREGGNHLGAQFAPFIGHSKKPGEGAVTTKVTGMHEICKLFPPNILPLEIDTDHPDRVRALIVDSGNIARSGADTQALEKALAKLELMVVIDVALTETARHAHYVLPAPTQFEKAEATFFTYGFPVPYFHLRKPVLEKEGDTLPEPEIYRRLLVALGAIPERFPVLERAAKLHRRYPGLNVYPAALAATMKLKPQWQAYVPVILYATLGRALPTDTASAASLWGVSQFWARRFSRQVAKAGYTGQPSEQAEKLFQRMLEDPRPIPLGEFDYEDLWKLIRHPDGKIHLYIPEMAEALSRLTAEQAELQALHDEWPFVLMAGERRAYNANQIYRTPDWRKTDRDGALRIHPQDAADLGVGEGDWVRVISRRGEVVVPAWLDDGVQRGMVTLPHGYGMLYTDPETGELRQNGPNVNDLTATDWRDAIAGTPYHKYVPVRLEAVRQDSASTEVA